MLLHFPSPSAAADNQAYLSFNPLPAAKLPSSAAVFFPNSIPRSKVGTGHIEHKFCPVSRQEEPDLYNMLENLCISRGLTMPSLRIIDSESLNAFASGLNEKQYSITVTRGLMNALEPAELDSVLQTMDEPIVSGSTGDDPALGDLNNDELERVLDSWEG